MSRRCIKGHACDHSFACPTCFPQPTAASEMNRYVDAAEREAGESARLRAEVRALRRERRALRKAMREAIEQMDQRAHYTMRDVIQRMNEALKPRKARRRKA